MRRDFGYGRPRRAPVWWPAGEAWPPRDRGFHWRRRRSGMLARAAMFAMVFLSLAWIGAGSVIAWIVRGAGLQPSGVQWALTSAIVFALMMMVFVAVMRRLAPAMADIVSASHRVADGDFDVRIRAQGPPMIRGVAAAFNDMTTRLARQEQQRRELMADIAHELRTPLSVVQGRLEGLIDGVYPTDTTQLQPLLDETRVLARLIEDLRTLANAESGVLTLDRESTDVGMLVRDAVSSLADDAAARKVTVTVEDEAAVVANVDPVRMRQVLVNLVANAINHSGEGSAVRVAARVADHALVVRVIDTGGGIAPEELTRIFDRFYKRPGSSGSGLGLTIAQSLVRAHGGEIRAESHPGAGTTITFSVPLG